jgi:hypothetical protein
MIDRRRFTTKLLAVLLSPLLIAGPAGAQVRGAQVEVSGLGLAPASFGSAPRPLASNPAALGLAPLLAAPSVGLLAPALVPAVLSAAAVPVQLAASVVPAALVPTVPAAARPLITAAPKSALSAVALAVSKGLSETIGSIIDGRPGRTEDATPAFTRAIIAKPFEAHSLLPGVRLDARPRRTDQGSVKVNDFHLAADHELAGGAKPIKLDAQANDSAGVEAALRALVDSNPAKYGAASADMAKVHVQFVPGSKENGQADVYYAVFRQWKAGIEKDGSPYHLLVDGGSLTFVLKIFQDGKPTVMATEGRLYPGVSADVMTVNFTDAELDAIAAKRLQSPPDKQPGRLKQLLSRLWERVRFGARKAGAENEPPVLLTREITNVNGVWRALNLYQASDLKSRPVIVAVDVRSGDAFAWSSEGRLRNGGPIAPGAAGAAFARGTTLTPQGGDHGPVDAMPLPFANVYDASGRVVAVTAADGTFTAPGAGAAAKLTIRLEGTYAKESDDHSKQNGPVSVTVDAVPGQTVRATLNPSGDAVELAADVNGYIYYSKQVAWLKDAAGIKDERILAPLAGGVRANRTDMPGNAYYSPADDSLNLQAGAVLTIKDKQGKPHKLELENTAQPSIIYHESTHRAVQILSQIALDAGQAASRAFRYVVRVMEPVMDGGVNEAIADTVSMYMRGNPLIGEGFYANAPAGPRNVIRTGENATKFDPKNPDPHAQGEAFMGFTWTLRQGLVQALGEAAGAAYAALLVVPTTLYGQPQDVPTAMLHVLIGSMTVDGLIPHEALIRAAASAHGVDLPVVKAAPGA